MGQKTVSLLIITLIAFTIYPLVPTTKALTEPTVSLVSSTSQVTQLHQTFTVNITISNVQNLWFWGAEISWDPTVLSVPQTSNNLTEGSFLHQAGSTVFLSNPVKNGTGEDISDALFSFSGESGSGVLATIEFQVIAQSSSTTIQLSNIVIEGPPPSGSDYGTAITPTSTTASTTISYVTGGLPAANAGPSQTVAQGAEVTFDGSESISTGTKTTYAWSFMYNGTEQSLSGVNPTFTFKIPGIYVVTLVVTDSNGASTPATVTITVQSNSKPVAVITVEGISKGQSVQAGQAVTFNGTGSSEANGGTIMKYLWMAGVISEINTAGKPNNVTVGEATIGTTATLTYNFSIGSDLKSEVYNVTLTVFDATNQNNTASTQITVVPSTSPTSTPPATTSTATPTHSTTQTPTNNPTSTPTPNDATQAGLPSYLIAIAILITIIVLAGSTIWLRKRT